MDQQVIDLYDRYTHGDINRRDFLDRLTVLTGSAAAAAALVPVLQCNYANAAAVPENDARLAIDRGSYDSPKGPAKFYMARPRAKGKRPAVVVIPQNRGLNPHIEDVARVLAVQGYLAMALDTLSTLGGTPGGPDDEPRREMHSKVPPADFLPLLLPSIAYLKNHAESTGKVGVVGFCFGGGMVNQIAMNSPDLAAAVAFYGPIPQDKSKVKDIVAPLLLHYASNDNFVNPGIAGWEEALKAAGKKYTLHMYPNTQHAFSDDTAGPRYDKAAADLAWQRTFAFFREHLGVPPNAA